MYVDVVVDQNTDATDTPYTYAAGAWTPRVGSRVSVPFARGNRTLDAYVIALREEAPAGVARIKEICGLDPERSLSLEAMETALWMRERYLCRAIEAIRLFVPEGKAPVRTPRDPLAGLEGEASGALPLTEEQERAFLSIQAPLREKKHQRFLLHGVTGSGKTEVYLQAMEEVLAQGRGGIVLVPEIALTPQVIRRFTSRFGKERVAVIHSRLTRTQRYAQWQRIKSGSAPLVIGARSAVFAPLADIGLIVLDEEHETSYKSDQSPKYETIEVATKRAIAHGAVLVAGSATPSLASYYRSEEKLFTRLTMTRRYNQTPLPAVRIADMRQELRAGNRSIFSALLQRSVAENLEAGRQVILFLNRRGYATFVSCRSCGYAVACPECGIAMTYHKDQGACVCHYCGRREALTGTCPSCGGSTIRTFGAGTQQVEEGMLELLPRARIARLDLDTARKKGSVEAMLADFEAGRLDILIGTQMVAKGLDVANVGLVGIVSADVTLNIPDFRSGERTFQLVTQAAGRSGRGDAVGEVIIQTYTPDHPIIGWASRHDYPSFYREEIQVRRQIQYPPFSDLFQLVVSDKDEEEAAKSARACADWLRQRAGEDLSILGPSASPLVKAGGQYRYQLIAKSKAGRRRETAGLFMALRRAFAADRKKSSLLTMDVNPYSFL